MTRHNKAATKSKNDINATKWGLMWPLNERNTPTNTRRGYGAAY